MDLLRPGAAGTVASGGAGGLAAGGAGRAASGAAGPPAAGGGGAPASSSGEAGSSAAGAGAAGAAGMPMTSSGAGAQSVASAGAAGMPAAGGGSGGAPGMEGAAGMGAAGAPATGATAGTLTVEFVTVSYGGEYAPLNYVAVWFETGAGEFVKTAARWAGAAHAGDLVAWTEASGGWGNPFFGGGNTADMTDAMSSATLRQHQTQTVTWDMKNAEMQLVPDGDYVAVLEMTESRARDRAGPLLRIPFTKGPTAQDVELPDAEAFTGIALHYAP